MSRISDSVKLLGLIVNTKPFTYQNNEVMCEYRTHAELSDLQTLKTSLIDERNSLPETASDQEKQELSDDIYFIDTVIENLSKAQ